MDIFDKIYKKQGPIGQHAWFSHNYFTFPKLEGEISNRMKFRGKEKIIWSLNNYLGLANHPEVRQTDAESAKLYGLARPMGARMMSGNSDLHEQLEKELSAFVGKEDTFVLNYGYQGIISMIDALLDRHDILVYDAESHACIIDGARLHLGKRFAFTHNNIENLEKQLQHATKLLGPEGSILVITEGVFGMSGDQGKLKEIVALKSKYNFRLLIDDAHGFGVMGPQGQGTHFEQGVPDGVDIYFATFAKAMASIGAFVSSKKEIILFLRYEMRSQTFAKALPMAFVVGNLKRLELIQKHPEFKQKLLTIVKAMQKGLKDRGFNIGQTNTCVTPVYLKGTTQEAANLIMDLRENFGVFCSMVIYPVIPKGEILIRIVPSADNTMEDVEITLNAFTEIAKRLKNKEYDSEIVNTPKSF